MKAGGTGWTSLVSNGRPLLPVRTSPSSNALALQATAAGNVRNASLSPSRDIYGIIEDLERLGVKILSAAEAVGRILEDGTFFVLRGALYMAQGGERIVIKDILIKGTIAVGTTTFTQQNLEVAAFSAGFLAGATASAYPAVTYAPIVYQSVMAWTGLLSPTLSSEALLSLVAIKGFLPIILMIGAGTVAGLACVFTVRLGRNYIISLYDSYMTPDGKEVVPSYEAEEKPRQLSELDAFILTCFRARHEPKIIPDFMAGLKFVEGSTEILVGKGEMEDAEREIFSGNVVYHGMTLPQHLFIALWLKKQPALTHLEGPFTARAQAYATTSSDRPTVYRSTESTEE